MTGTVWLVRYAEVFLKSDPVRRNWERVLAHAIERRMPDVAVRIERGRLWATGPVDPDVLRRIFGVASFSEAVFSPLDDLDEAALAYADAHGIGEAASFAVRVKRSGKHAFRSPQKAADLGGVILEAHPDLRVDLGCPDFELFVEIRDDRCYLYHEVVAGPGGLPEGVEGTLVALFSGGIDSPVAAYMMMRRGCRIVPLYVDLDPYLDEDALAKALAVLAALRDYDPDLDLVVRTDDYLARAKALMRRSEERLTCVVCKRRMYRIAAALAEEVGALGIVTGESLGQVASQTLDNLAVLDGAVAVPVYRPLIGLDKEEIIGIARRIGTFTPSIAPGRGCRAVPDVAATKSALTEVVGIEARVEAADRSR
ncbi:MAG: tRNA uracil 4-sulfurtransferase ThiI [Methanospirillum sp.]